MSMFGKKDKKPDRKRGREKASGDKKGSGGDLAAMFGLNMDIPGIYVIQLDITGHYPYLILNWSHYFNSVDDSELEAELMAMEGVSPDSGGGRGKRIAPMSVADIDKMVAGLDDDEGDYEDDSDFSDEDQLLGELQVSSLL